MTNNNCGYKTLLSSVLFLLIFSIAKSSDNIVVTGKVAFKNEPVPFANIYIKGMGIGTACNIEGKFVSIANWEEISAGHGNKEIRSNLYVTGRKVIIVTRNLKGNSI